ALAGDAGEPLPEVARPVLAHDSGGARVLAAKFGIAGTRPVIALCPGAEYGPAKQWPAGRFAALAGRLAKSGFSTWIFGSPKEAALGESIVALAKAESAAAAPVNLAGRTSLIEAVDLLSLAAAVVTNDSGLMHVAAALERPLVALYGSTTPAMTPPLSDRVRILERTLPCRPCFQRTCPLGHLDCLNLIPASEVPDGALDLAAR